MLPVAEGVVGERLSYWELSICEENFLSQRGLFNEIAAGMELCMRLLAGFSDIFSWLRRGWQGMPALYFI